MNSSGNGQRTVVVGTGGRQFQWTTKTLRRVFARLRSETSRVESIERMDDDKHRPELQTSGIQLKKENIAVEFVDEDEEEFRLFDHSLGDIDLEEIRSFGKGKCLFEHNFFRRLWQGIFGLMNEFQLMIEVQRISIALVC